MPPEEAGAAEPQAGASAQPQAGTTTGGQEPRATTGQAPAAATQSGTGTSAATSTTGEDAEARAARLERELSEARKEAAGHRTRAATLEREKQQAQQAGMSEQERAEARATAAETKAAQLETRLTEQALLTSTYQAAAKLGYRSPELAYRLLDRSEIEFDDQGVPKNVEKLLRELAARETYLVKAGGADFGGGTRGTQPAQEPGMNELIKAAFGKS